MKRSVVYSRLLVAALAATAMLTGCGLWHAAEREDTPTYNTRFLIDSLYTTPSDSAVFRILSGAMPNQVHFTSIDYGDGSQDSLSITYPSFPRIAHLYRSAGKYTVVLQALYRGVPLAADTAVVIVQDYVRPSLATKVRVRISGITLHSYTRLPRPGTSDSVWLSRTDDIEVTAEDYDESGRPLTLESLNTLVFQHASHCDPAEEHVLSHGMREPVSLSANGDSLFFLEFSVVAVEESPEGAETVTTHIGVRNIPLKPDSVPSREHAIYTARIPADEFSTVVSFGVVRKLQRESGLQTTSNAHISVYAPEITVEFLR